MTMRDQLVEKLSELEDLDVDVVPYSRKVTNLERATLFVKVTEVRRSVVAGGWRDYDVTLILAVPQVDPKGGADDALDGNLEDVLAVLESADVDPIGVRWLRATRAVLDELFPAYEIATAVTTERNTP